MADPGATATAGPRPEPWLSSWGDRAEQRRWPLARDVVVVGRSPDADVVVEGDPLVSRVHARLELVGGRWTLVDDGLSRNGTWVGGQRVRGRVTLHDRDAVRVGATVLVFCACEQDDGPPTLAGEPLLPAAQLTPAQLGVVRALCRPYGSGEGVPATNAQIAAELCLSVDAVKTHLREIAHRLGLEHLPQNEKRLRTAQTALRLGLAPAS
ncbi:MAG: putative LuxR family transcriptional regulator [Frankiales bacterium]|nr:putative LuxR family transcriptional regulator [Frankiales bacterium]